MKHYIIAGACMLLLASCGGGEEKNQTPQLNADFVQAEKTAQKLVTVGADAFEIAVNSGEYTVLDLRTNAELSESGIIGENVTQIDMYEDPEYLTKLESLDPGEKYAIYCRSGGRTGRMLSQMKELGFVDVLELQGGIGNWENNGKSFVEYKNEQ